MFGILVVACHIHSGTAIESHRISARTSVQKRHALASSYSQRQSAAAAHWGRDRICCVKVLRVVLACVRECVTRLNFSSCGVSFGMRRVSHVFAAAGCYSYDRARVRKRHAFGDRLRQDPSYKMFPRVGAEASCVCVPHHTASRREESGPLFRFRIYRRTRAG